MSFTKNVWNLPVNGSNDTSRLKLTTFVFIFDLLSTLAPLTHVLKRRTIDICINCVVTRDHVRIARIVATMNVERVVKHSHFRLKVDLSRFFQDARQQSWIFVDNTKVQRISHIEQHIAKLFNIPRPFHLLLNDIDYLPPTEDVRILEKNETILVVPGSGMDASSASITLSDINVHSGLDKLEVSSDSTHDKREVESISISKVTKTSNVLNGLNNTTCDTPATSTNTTADAMYYSMIDDTEVNTNSETMNNDLMEHNLTENDRESSIISGTKRKRVRKRKSKNQLQEVSPLALPKVPVEENKVKKLKVINSYIIPAVRHIRFDKDGNKEENIAKNIAQEISLIDSYMSKDSPSNNLAALLALGKSSTPMFTNEKEFAKQIVDNSNQMKNQSSCSITENDVAIEKSACDAEKERKGFYKNIEIKKLPGMTKKPQIKDIIAFKTLKIGADYTPQLSEFIVTEVVDFCPKSTNYTLRVLEGKEEIQVPLGKFSLSEDENISPAEVFLLNYKQMKDLRLIL